MKKRKYRINWGEAIVPGAALLFGAAFFYQTCGAPLAAMYWPIIAAVLTGLFGIFILFKFIINQSCPQVQHGSSSEARSNPAKQAGLILISSAGYLVCLPFLGFSISNTIFLVAMSRGLGSRKWGRILGTALGVSAFLHIALVVLMKMNLPRLTIGRLVI